MQKYGGGDEDVGRRGSFCCAILRSLAGRKKSSRATCFTRFLVRRRYLLEKQEQGKLIEKKRVLGRSVKSFACFFFAEMDAIDRLTY